MTSTFTSHSRELCWWSNEKLQHHD